MGAQAAFALKFTQWSVRGIQFSCVAVVAAIFVYFLATLRSQDFEIPTTVKAVVGIAGFGLVYTAAGLLLLCFLAGRPVAAFMAVVLDVAFAAAFVYVAIANRAGAGSCTGIVHTVYGDGDASDGARPRTADGTMTLPSYRQACRMESACLGVSVVAVVFFLTSTVLEFVLVRHRRKEQRFGPSPANNYTSGYGRGRGFFGIFKRHQTTEEAYHPDVLPIHPKPGEMRVNNSHDTAALVGSLDPAAHGDHVESEYRHSGQISRSVISSGHRSAHANINGSSHVDGYRYSEGTFAA